MNVDQQTRIEAKIYDAAEAGDPHAMIAYALIQVCSTMYEATEHAFPVRLFADEGDVNVKVQGGEK